MLNTLKVLVNRFRLKTQVQPTGSSTSQGAKTEQLEHREKLVNVRNHMDELTTTNAFDINAIRQKVHDELRASDVSARQKDRASINKWFNKCDLTDSGSFDITAFQRRMEEMERAEEEVYMESLPAQEDMLLAFGKPEHDFFESEKISLSGVFLRVNPNEDFEDEYSTPLLPVYHCNDDAVPAEHVNLLDQEPIVRDEYDLNFSVEETSEELTVDAQASSSPDSMPLSAIEDKSSMEKSRSKIDPSVLFVERFSAETFDLSAFQNAAETIIDLATDAAMEAVSEEVLTEASNLLAEENAAIDEPVSNSSVKSASKSNSRSGAKPSDSYWAESDRLKRFGRRKTSAFCSSTRLNALTQIA